MKKHLKSIFLLAFIALAVPFIVYGSTMEVTFAKWFTSTDTGDQTGTTGTSTFSAYGGTVAFSGSTPVVDFYSVTADNAANRLEILTEGAALTTLSGGHTNGSNALHVNGTTNFSVDDYIAIQDVDGFEVNKIDSIGVATLNLERVTTSAYATGASIKEMTAIYSLPVGNATVTTPAKLVGERGQAMAWHLNGSAGCRINNVSGHYE